MLRSLLLLFLGANALLWAYGQGWLAAVGWPLEDHREPGRLAQQVAPEALRLLTDPVAASTAAVATAPPLPDPVPEPTNPADAAPAPTACWQLGGLPAPAGAALRQALAQVDGLTAADWVLEAVPVPARWIVYLGPFASADAQQQRRNALRSAGVDVRAVTTPALQPGLALGTYSSQEAAQRALRDANGQGVRDARVVQERPESQTWSLRLPALTEALRERVQALPPLAGQPLQPCA